MQLTDLKDLLDGDPVQERTTLRARIQEAQRVMRGAGADDGLVALVLRNMLMDLARSPGHFDARYFARQLNTLVAGML